MKDDVLGQETLVIPVGSLPTQPQYDVLTGDAIPAELIAYYAALVPPRTVTVAVLWGTPATSYTYDVVLDNGVHAQGIVAAGVVDEIQRWDPTQPVVNLGSVGPAAWAIRPQGRLAIQGGALTIQYDSSFTINLVEQPRGLIAFATGVGTGVVAVETVFATLNGLYQAGRAFQIRARLGTVGTCQAVQITVRRTNLAGAIIAQSQSLRSTAGGFGDGQDWSLWVRNNTAADINDQLVVTVTPLIGNVQTIPPDGAGLEAISVSVWDIGAAADIPTAAAL